MAPLTLFYAYASEDERFLKRLEKHLSVLRQQELIDEMHTGQILPGTDRSQFLDRQLMTASIVLLLISPDFLSSEYWTSERLQPLLKRHAAGGLT